MHFYIGRTNDAFYTMVRQKWQTDKGQDGQRTIFSMSRTNDSCYILVGLKWWTKNIRLDKRWSQKGTFYFLADQLKNSCGL